MCAKRAHVKRKEEEKMSSTCCICLESTICPFKCYTCVSGTVCGSCRDELKQINRLRTVSIGAVTFYNLNMYIDCPICRTRASMTDELEKINDDITWTRDYKDTRLVFGYVDDKKQLKQFKKQMKDGVFMNRWGMSWTLENGPEEDDDDVEDDDSYAFIKITNNKPHKCPIQIGDGIIIELDSDEDEEDEQEIEELFNRLRRTIDNN